MTQSKDIEDAINDLIERGELDKQEIYNKVEKILQVPRPTIRRVVRTMAIEFKRRYEILKPVSDQTVEEALTELTSQK